MKFCNFCNNSLTERQRNFCSKSCKDLWYGTLIPISCNVCSKPHNVSRRSISKTSFQNVCRSCCTRRFHDKLDFSGSQNPNWKGGHSHWQQGKLSYDKEGLHWDVTSAQARERDKGVCQDCGKSESELGYTLHCHHINPFRCCQSHAVDNLVSLCRSCHKKAEAKIKDLWNGRVFCGTRKYNMKLLCSVCSKRRKLNQGVCGTCKKDSLRESAKELYKTLGTYAKVAVVMGYPKTTVKDWIFDYPHQVIHP